MVYIKYWNRFLLLQVFIPCSFEQDHPFRQALQQWLQRVVNL